MVLSRRPLPWSVPERLSRGLVQAGPVLVVIVVAAAVAGAAAWAHVPAKLGFHGGFVDLSAYRYGGRLVLDGLPLYGSRDPATNLGFTYPPFAAVAMALLAVLPVWLAAALWTAASVAALAGVIAVAARAMHRLVPGRIVALLTVGAFALEPVWQNLTFGQINLLLMFAVFIDLVRPAGRWSGVLVGVAAGVKLTPLVFVVLLVLVGRHRTAIRALAAFAGTVVIGLVTVPAAAQAYWTDNLIKAGRVGPPELAHNQSVFGALTRMLDSPAPTLLWLAVAGPLALAVVGVGAVCWRRGDRVLGTGLAALAMLLASPVSWSHHWVWAVPVGLALWERSRWMSALWTAVFVVRPFAWLPAGDGREYRWHSIEHVPGDVYLLTALALTAWVAMRLHRPARHAGSGRPEAANAAGPPGVSSSRPESRDQWCDNGDATSASREGSEPVIGPSRPV
ncbi:membrane protein [Actinoplanes cyaneus]|uniref:Membrane protein n=1 Tax=Actinoplanes cyaneus TaxID=52696 RepID=A0A919MCN2_9ACTN|nr:glycosyltransferase 87 family protein [Actinoplanes cyaneus]MCW2144119.1 alpha-1,2-mannosyltransferase [Actinoplanes cyaneus]GID70849.1 membrane protein [Actinoplanes cyaneus]